jgi:ATP-dependent helicase/nuclease subunit B
MISDDEEVFELNHQNIDRLSRLYKDNSFEKLDKVLRFHNDELTQLEKSLYKTDVHSQTDNTRFVFLNSYNNAYDEIESIANRILYIVEEDEKRGKNTCFENIAVLTRDVDKYKNIFKMTFNLYGIPYFIDDKKELAKEPLVSLVLAFMDIISKNYDYESMFAYLKTGLTNITDESDIDLIENYVLKWGVKGKRWEEDFTIEDENLERINLIRSQIVSPIMKFKERFEGRKTAKEIATELYNFLSDINVFDNISNIVLKYQNSENHNNIRISQEYSQVWNTIISVLDELVAVIGDEQISFDKFKNIFKVGVSNIEISVIPTTKDKVIIGDVQRTRNSDIKTLFVVGLNDGSFPKTFINEGFINDQERETLLTNGIELAKDSKNLLKQEYFNIYKALAVPSDYLYLSYPTADLEGKEIRPSFLINDIKRIFPNISEAPEEHFITKNASFKTLLNTLRGLKDDGKKPSGVWKEVNKWYEINDADRYSATIKGLDFTNTIEFQSKELSKTLYGNTMNTSVSRLEKYVSCPFSFYLNYGLNLKEREVYTLGVPDIGSFLHEIIDRFSKKVLEDSINLKSLSKEDCDIIVDGISDDVILSFRNNLFSSTGRLRTLVAKLKAQVKKVVWLIVTQLNSGSFDILGSEVEFGLDKEFPPIVIELNDDQKLSLSGKVDRVDITSIDDKKYIRIVDYKSSNKAIKLSNVYYGVQLQLIAYTDAISGDSFDPAGAFYLKLDDPIERTKKQISKEELEEEIKNKLKLNGVIISNARLIEAMDSEFNSDKAGKAYESEILNLKRNKEGELSKMPVVSPEQFKDLRSHMRKTLKDIGNEIMSGNVKNEPLYKREGNSLPCSYCPFDKACRFDKNLGNKVRYNETLKDDEVLAKIKS